MLQNQDGSTTTFNEYDVETDDAFHNNHNHHQKINLRTPTLTNSTTNTKKVNNNNNNNSHNNTQNSILSNQSLSPRLDSPL